MAKFVQLRNGVPYIVDVPIGIPYDKEFTFLSDQIAPFDFTLLEGQTYNVGQNEIIVAYDGVLWVKGMDYTEKNTTQITVQRNVQAGSTIRVRR